MIGEPLVCGVDESPHAADVVAVAVALAERLGLRLRLVHSVQPDVFLAGDERRELLRAGEQRLEALGANDSPEDRIIELGDPAALLRSALEEGAALAVVGSRGRGPGRAALLGSVSNALVGSSPCPVVVVPPGAATEISPTPTVVCGVDGSPAAEAGLEYAGGLARALGGSLLAVHVRSGALEPHATSLIPGRQPFSGPIEDQRVTVATLERPLAHLALDVPTGTRVESGQVATRLTAVAAEEASALLVVGSRRHGLVRAAVFGSVSSQLAASAPVPVVIVPVKDADPHGSKR
jgi:nucleotide-binding universal stress UspA family protein